MYTYLQWSRNQANETLSLSLISKWLEFFTTLKAWVENCLVSRNIVDRQLKITRFSKTSKSRPINNFFHIFLFFICSFSWPWIHVCKSKRQAIILLSHYRFTLCQTTLGDLINKWDKQGRLNTMYYSPLYVFLMRRTYSNRVSKRKSVIS